MKKPDNERHTKKRQDLINEIIELRINQGYSNINLLNYLINDKNLSQPYAYELMRNAKGAIAEMTLAAFKEDIENEIARWEMLYQKAIEEKNLFIAKDIQKEISKIKGLYIERQEVTHQLELKTIKLIEIQSDDKKLLLG
jgi:hypothetical protein